MVWTIELTPEAQKQVARMGTQEARRVLKYLHERVRLLENPRALGEPLKGSRFSGLWRYRVGPHRVLCEISDEKIRILVVQIGHRREIYK